MKRPTRRALFLLLALLVLVWASQAQLRRAAGRVLAPLLSVERRVSQASGAWRGHEIFSVARRPVVLAAIADGRWPEPARVWDDQLVLPIAPDLYAVGPDLTGAMMLYSVPGAGGRSAWLASPGPDGRWSSGADDPEAAAAAIDRLVREAEGESLQWIRSGRVLAPGSYHVRWGDDHIVLFEVMLAARGRNDGIRDRLQEFPDTLPPIEQLDLPQLWRDEAPMATKLLAAMATAKRAYSENNSSGEIAASEGTT